MDIPPELEGTRARRRSGSGWEIDRHIPLVLVLSIIGSAAGGVWWLSKLSDRVDNVEGRTTLLEKHEETARDLAMQINARLARIEATIELALRLRGETPPAGGIPGNSKEGRQ